MEQQQAVPWANVLNVPRRQSLPLPYRTQTSDDDSGSSQLWTLDQSHTPWRRPWKAIISGGLESKINISILYFGDIWNSTIHTWCANRFLYGAVFKLKLILKVLNGTMEMLSNSDKAGGLRINATGVSITILNSNRFKVHMYIKDNGCQYDYWSYFMPQL